MPLASKQVATWTKASTACSGGSRGQYWCWPQQPAQVDLVVNTGVGAQRSVGTGSQ